MTLATLVDCVRIDATFHSNQWNWWKWKKKAFGTCDKAVDLTLVDNLAADSYILFLISCARIALKIKNYYRFYSFSVGTTEQNYRLTVCRQSYDEMWYNFQITHFQKQHLLRSASYNFSPLKHLNSIYTTELPYHDVLWRMIASSLLSKILTNGIYWNSSSALV